MSCARYRAQLSRYLDDELPPRQRSELLAHVATCPDCAAALARFRQSEVLLKKLPESKPSADVRGAVLRAARRRRRAPHGVRGHLVWWLSAGGRVNPALSVGTLVLVVGLTTVAALAQTFPTLGVRLGFAPPPTPTSSYLDVPASPTPLPGAALTPRLVSSNPFDGERDVDVQRSLTVRFDQAMERRSVERAFRLDPPAPGSFAWDADNELRFTPGAPGLLRGVTYTVALSDGARSLSGATLPPGPLWSFVTLDPPVLLDVRPAPGESSVVPTTTLVLTFSQPMDPASVEAALRLDGASSAGAAWHLRGLVRADEGGRVLRVGPAAALPAGRATVTLGNAAHDQAGGALVPASWSFQVAAPNDTIVFGGPRLLTLALTGNGVVPAISYEVGPGAGDSPPARATFSLYALPQDRLLALLPWLVADRSTPAGGPWPIVATGSLRLVQTWTSALPPGRDLAPGGLSGQTAPPIRDPGVYLLTAGSPGAGGDQRVVVVSEAGPVIVAAGDRWLVWTGDLAPARAWRRAHVRLFTADGAALLEGDADAEGLFSASLPAGAVPAAALVTRADVPSLALVDPATAPLPGGAPLTATVITDRAHYAPGDAVRFTAVVPGAADSPGGSSATIQVRLRDPADRILGVLTLKPDRLGAVTGSFALAPALPAGVYTLEVETGGSQSRRPVPVAPPTAPGALQLQLATPVAGPLFAGSVFTPTLLALDAGGTPVPGVVVTVTLGGEVAATAPVTATTGADGLARPALRLPPLPGGPATLQLRAEARNAGGDQAALAAAVAVEAGRLDVHLALSGQAYTPGSTLTATATVRDLAGAPVAGQPVTVGLYVRGGRVEPADALNSVPGVTDAAGQVTMTLPLPLLGNFIARAVTTDAAGAVLVAEQQLWVYEENSSAAAAVPALADALLATPDQASYAPGATARLLVQSGTAGPLLALATLNGSLTGRQVVTLGANGAVISIPIPDSARDGTPLIVSLLHYVAGAGGVQLVRADVALPVVRDASRLTVDLQLDDPAAEYHPGDSMLIHVRLRDSAGRPQAGQVVLTLAPPGSDRAAVPPAGPTLAGSAWPGGGAPAADGTIPTPPTAPRAYWNAALLTDASGQASVTVPVPEGEGAWQLQAWGFAADGLAGQGILGLTVRATLDLRWTPPTRLVQGDTLHLRAVARNATTETLSADVRLSPDGTVLRLDSPGLVSLTLRPGETRLLDWQVDAPTPGTAPLVLEAGWGPPGAAAAGRSRHEARLTVVPYGLPTDQYHAGTLAGDETFPFTLPAAATPALAALDVRVDPTLGGVLADTLAAQLAAGVGQGAPGAVAERLTVGAALSRLARQGQVPAESLPENLSPALALDLQYLYETQNPDGSWGGWPGGAGDLPTTAAVLEGLGLLADEQVQGGGSDIPAVDRGTRDRGVAWLRAAAAPLAQLPGAPPTPGSDPAANRRAQALYVLTLYNSAEAGEIRQLIAASGQLSPAGRGWLVLALERLGSHEDARTLLAGLAPAGPAPIATPPGPAAPPPTAADLALSLQALLTVDPDGSGGQDAARAAAALLAARQGTGWAGEGATGAAVQALAAWVPRAPATGGGSSAKYRLLVNGQVVKEVVMGPRGSGGTLRLQVPGSALRAGENQVRLAAEGDGTLYYSLHLVARAGSPDRPLAGDHAPDFAASLLRETTPAPGTGWRVGAPVQVTLTLTLGQAVAGIRLIDPLPGAFAGVRDLRFTPATPPASGIPPVLLGSSAGLEGVQFRLGPLQPGTYRLSYTARLDQAGVFGALPASGVVPDAPGLWVWSGGRALTIER